MPSYFECGLRYTYRVLLAETTVYCSETAYASLSQFFFLNITKHRHAFLAIWLVEKKCSLLRVVDCSCVPHAVFRATSGSRNFCSRGPRGLKFFCIVTPSWGADHINFKKNRRKKNFSCLISPTYFAAHNSCSKGHRGLKFVMRIDPPHAGPITTFLF